MIQISHLRRAFKLNQNGFAMPMVIMLIVIMSFVAYAALLQSNNALNLAYKQTYIQMARTSSKAAIDYAQEQFDNSLCGNYTGSTEQDLVNNSRYRVTYKAEVLSTSADGLEKTIKGTGSVYLPRLSSTAKYVFDIRSEIVRTYAACKTPDNFSPTVWLDSSDLTTLFKPGTVGTTTVTPTTSFGSSGATSRDTLEERVDNGTQTAGAWQSNDLEMHTCDTTEFSSSVCSSNSTKYLYDGIVFQNVNVPKNATITSAIVNYDCASGGSSGPLDHQVFGIYKTSTNLHPDLFTSTGTSQLRTPMTTSSLHTTASASLSTNNCPPGNGNTMDVKNVVQEIVNNSNWDPTTGGGRLGLGFQRTSGNGARKFSKDNIRLAITYTSNSGPQPTTANNDSIAEWHDKSGHANHAKSTYGNVPTRVDNQINGKTIVRFNSGAMLSSLTAALSAKREMTVFAVLKANYSTSSSDGRVVSGMTNTTSDDTVGTTTIIPLLRNGANSGFSNIYASSAASNRTDYICGAACASTPYIYASIFTTQDANHTTSNLKGQGAPVNQKLNISPSGSNTYTYGINQLYFGGRRSGTSPGSGRDYFNGDYAELIVYDHALTCRQIESIEEYLRAKWNTSASALATTCPADVIPTL
jgi:hypothetical protein